MTRRDRPLSALAVSLLMLLGSYACTSETEVGEDPSAASSGAGGEVATTGSGGDMSTTSSSSAATGGQGGAPDVAPGPVGELGAISTCGDADIGLGWTNPADVDLAGVLVVRSREPIELEPTDGTTYTTDDDLGDGLTVLHAGPGTQLTDADTTPGGLYHYAAWAYDDALQYSERSTATVRRIALGEQEASIEVGLDGTVMIGQQPADLELSGDADFEGSFGLLELTVANNTERVIFNLAGVVSDPDEASLQTTELPDGTDVVYFGPLGLAPGDSVTIIVELEDVSGETDSFPLDLSFIDAPSIITDDGQMFASNGIPHEARGEVPVEDDAGTQGDAELRNLDIEVRTEHGAVSPDGRFLYVAARNDPAIVQIDLTTGEQSFSDDLSSDGFGSTAGVAVSPDGTKVYVALNDGADARGGGNDGPAIDVDVLLVQLDAVTLEEQQRLVVLEGVDDTTARRLALSADGTKAVMPVFAGAEDEGDAVAYLLDVAGWEVLDADDEEEGAQPVLLASGLEWRFRAAMSPDGSKAVVLHDATEVHVIDTATFEIDTLEIEGGGISVGDVMIGRDGRVYASTKRSIDEATLAVFDVVAQTAVHPDPDLQPVGNERQFGPAATGLLMDPCLPRYYALNEDSLAAFDFSDERFDWDDDPDNGITNLEQDHGGDGYMAVITPF